jgi:hypothetical protein
MDDGEFIGDGRHYCVVPPTRHPKGGEYHWLNGPPLGPSEFPLLDPFEAGVLSAPTPDRREDRTGGVSIRHSSSSCVYSDSSASVSESCSLPEQIRECILKTLPTGPGQRNRLLHQFARALRDHIPDEGPLGVLFIAVRTWWQMASPVIDTKDFNTSLYDFRRAWSAVRVPMSMSRPLAALRRGSVESGAPDARARLLNACRELARETGGVFYLSKRAAGKAIGVSPTRADVLLKALVTCGALVIVKPGRPSRRKRRTATFYRLGSEAACEAA